MVDLSLGLFFLSSLFLNCGETPFLCYKSPRVSSRSVLTEQMYPSESRESLACV